MILGTMRPYYLDEFGNNYLEIWSGDLVGVAE
jgi:hypothetical protein